MIPLRSPRCVAGLVAAAACLASCSSPSSKDAPASSTASSAPVLAASATSSVAPKTVPPPVPPIALSGSTIARAPAEDVLYVVDEDHGVIRRLALPLGSGAPAAA